MPGQRIVLHLKAMEISINAGANYNSSLKSYLNKHKCRGKENLCLLKRIYCLPYFYKLFQQ